MNECCSDHAVFSLWWKEKVHMEYFSWHNRVSVKPLSFSIVDGKIIQCCLEICSNMWQRNSTEVSDFIWWSYFRNAVVNWCHMFSIDDRELLSDPSRDIKSSCQSAGKVEADQCTATIQTKFFNCLLFPLKIQIVVVSSYSDKAIK